MKHPSTARAQFLGGNVGKYHTDCPLDHALLDWKGVPYTDLKQEIVQGADDQALAAYLDGHGQPKTPEEVKAFSDHMDTVNPYHNPEQKDYYASAVSKLGLNPATTPMFKYAEADDKASHES